MKVSNIGGILLTLMVLTKYFISLNTMTHKDGALSGGLAVDYTVFQKELFSTPVTEELNPLLAYNSMNLIAVEQNSESVSKTTDNPQTTETTPAEGYLVNGNETLEGPAPMEYLNSLVVYNPSNPVISHMTTQYPDPEDSEPLDQGNTLIDEMQMMMPRR